jgi:tRNA(Ile)-lysidine synthase
MNGEAKMLSVDKRRLKSVTGSTLDLLEKKIYIKLSRLCQDLENQKILIAVSGGVDSVALLSLVSQLASRLKIKPLVCHIDHAVRGADSLADAEFVELLAKKYSMPFFIARLQGTTRTSSEAFLREKRYEVLFNKMREVKAAYVVTAHHRDDLLETRLMRLLQGAGIQGLRAMDVKSKDGLLRPFLDVTRRDLEAYAQRRNLTWCVDATNLDTRRLRNWIRRNWLGVLRQDHPEYVDNLFESLERIVRAQVTESEKDEQNKNLSESLERKASHQDSHVHEYLRAHSKHRVTSLHVKEFKKRLTASRKNFTFRLAGVDWSVSDTLVRPLKPS